MKKICICRMNFNEVNLPKIPTRVLNVACATQKPIFRRGQHSLREGLLGSVNQNCARKCNVSSLEVFFGNRAPKRREKKKKQNKEKRKAMCCNRLADRVVLQMISAKQPEGCQIGRRLRLPLQLAIKKRLGAIHKPLPSRACRVQICAPDVVERVLKFRTRASLHQYSFSCLPSVSQNVKPK